MIAGRRIGARKLAYRHFIGEAPPAWRMRTICSVPGCWNPWHVDRTFIPNEPAFDAEVDEIEDCIDFILGFPDREPPYDKIVVEAARHRIKEEGL